MYQNMYLLLHLQFHHTMLILFVAMFQISEQSSPILVLNQFQNKKFIFLDICLMLLVSAQLLQSCGRSILHISLLSRAWLEGERVFFVALLWHAKFHLNSTSLTSGFPEILKTILCRQAFYDLCFVSSVLVEFLSLGGLIWFDVLKFLCKQPLACYGHGKGRM